MDKKVVNREGEKWMPDKGIDIEGLLGRSEAYNQIDASMGMGNLFSSVRRLDEALKSIDDILGSSGIEEFHSLGYELHTAEINKLEADLEVLAEFPQRAVNEMIENLDTGFAYAMKEAEEGISSIRIDEISLKGSSKEELVTKPSELCKRIIHTIEERKQADIEELCLLLSYEKDLTGSEKKRRDIIINQVFEVGDIQKMRAVAEELSKKGNSKWTQSERSFMEQVQRYEAEEGHKQADIEELCLLLSYEKDLTGSEKKRRDTIINRIFEVGDIQKMRAVKEKLSKKGNSKWTQSERSFMEQVQRYRAAEEETEQDTIEGTGKVNEKYVTMEQLEYIGFSGVNGNMITALNDTLELYGITDSTHIQHFLAQCRQEGSLSLTEAGWCDDEYVKEYTMMYEPRVPSYKSDGSVYYKAIGLGNTEEGDGYRFRGGGYIQITGRSNYQAFADSLNNEEAANKIMSGGADAIKENYAWQAAGFWWSENGMNERIDNGASMLEISRAVNLGPYATSGTPNHMTERTNYYTFAQEAIK